ncbi:MAG: tyrosine-type recombinase/integrase, partial [Chitinophagales bacterium]
DRVFVLTNGKKLYPNFIYRTIKNYLSEVTSQKGIGPHSLRHSFATHLLNEGAELNAIKGLLGHSSLASTQVYTHNSIEKLKHIHKLSHPKS